MWNVFNIFKRKHNKKQPLDLSTPKNSSNTVVIEHSGYANTAISNNTINHKEPTVFSRNPPPLRIPVSSPRYTQSPSVYDSSSRRDREYISPSYVPQPVETDDSFTSGLMTGIVAEELIDSFDKSDSSQNDDVFSGGGGSGGGGGASASWSDDSSTKTDDTPDMNTFSDSSSGDSGASDLSSGVDAAFDSN